MPSRGIWGLWDMNLEELLLRVGAILRRAKINNEKKVAIGTTVRRSRPPVPVRTLIDGSSGFPVHAA